MRLIFAKQVNWGRRVGKWVRRKAAVALSAIVMLYLAAGVGGAEPRKMAARETGKAPASGRATIPEDLALYLSCGDTGKPGQLFQVDGAGKVLGTIGLHEAPSGIAGIRGSLTLAIATSIIGAGQVVTVQPNGSLSRTPLEKRFPAPISAARDPVSDDIIIADNDLLTISRLLSAPAGKQEPILQVQLQAPMKHFPSMHIAATRDGYIIFGSSDPKGVYRFKATSGATLGQPLLPAWCAVAADPNSNLWVALQNEELRIFDGDKEQPPFQFPAGTRPDHYGLVTFGPGSSVITVLHTGRGVEVTLVDTQKRVLHPLFAWEGKQIKCIALLPRMNWLKETEQ